MMQLRALRVSLVAASPLTSSMNWGPPLTFLGNNCFIFFFLHESSLPSVALNCSRLPKTTRKALQTFSAELNGSGQLSERSLKRCLTNRLFAASGSSRSTKSCASPKATTNYCSTTANGASSSSPVKAVRTGSWQPSLVPPPNSFPKAQAPSFVFAPTRRAASSSMITRARVAGAGARCRFAATDIKSQPFPAAMLQAAASPPSPNSQNSHLHAPASTSRTWAALLSTRGRSYARRSGGLPEAGANRARK